MFEDILSSIRDEAGSIKINEVNMLNPLVLAYVGDAVYDLFIRTYLVADRPGYNVHKLHVESTGFVKAHAQSDIIKRLLPQLTEKEISIVKRGRNSKSGFTPKNADVIEYRMATGFEALIGYLYLSGDSKRLLELLNFSINNWQDNI